MSKPLLTENTVESAMSELNGWSRSKDGKAIEKTFEFADFKQAFAFMTYSALHAETLDHHPEWVNVYNHVEIKLTTHDANGITELDLILARVMDKAAS